LGFNPTQGKFVVMERMLIRALKTILCIVMLLIANFGHSSTAPANHSTYSSKDLSSRIWNADFLTQLNSSLHQLSDQDHQLSQDFLLSTGFKFPVGTNFGFVLSANKDYRKQRKFLWEDGYFSLSRTFETSWQGISFTPLSRLIMPLSESSKDVKKLQTAVYAGLQTNIDFAKITPHLALAPLTAKYRIYTQKNFHRYKVDLQGASNTSYSLANRLILSYALSDKWSLGFDGIYSRGFTYGGISRDNYSHDESVSYAITKNLVIGLGHTIGGNSLAVNGVDSAVESFDNRKSTVYSVLNYNF
jgi:hypothetical protein